MATAVDITRLGVEHAGEALTLQRAAYVTEAQLYRDPHLPPLTETLDEMAGQLASSAIIALGAWDHHRLVGAVRLRPDDAVAHLGRLIVAPDRWGEGIGSALLVACEQALNANSRVAEIRLFTGADSLRTLRLYERHGYRRQREEPAGTHTLVHLTKVLES